MDNNKTGGPAFPVGEKWTERNIAGGRTECSKGALYNGMTLRDYFAAKAMTALMREWGMWTPNVPPFKKTHIEQDGYAVCLSGMDKEDIDCLARYSYSFADAMLKAREQ